MVSGVRESTRESLYKTQKDAKCIYAQEHTPGVGVEMDLENSDKSVGKMYHYKLHSSLPEWPPNIRWVNMDFLTATNLLVRTATAIFSSRNPLTRELENEFKHKELLFKQRKRIGQVAGIDPTLTHRPGQYVLIMITRMNHYA